MASNDTETAQKDALAVAKQRAVSEMEKLKTQEDLGEVTVLENGRKIVVPSDMPSKALSDVSSDYDHESGTDKAEKSTKHNSQLALAVDASIPLKYQIEYNITPEHLMGRLSKNRLKQLQKLWEDNPEGLELVDYLKMMMDEVPCRKDEKLEIIYALIKLFQQVDINGDQSMQWTEFVQYIIDRVTSESIQAQNDALGNLTPISKVIEIQQQSSFIKMKRSGIPVDKGKHKRPMQDVIKCIEESTPGAISTKTEIFFSEQDSTTLQWYSTKMKPILMQEVPVRNPEANKVLSIAYQDMSANSFTFGPQGTTSIYGCLCSDNYLYLYVKARGRFEFFRDIYLGEVRQLKLWHLKEHKVWLTAGDDFKLRQWNLSPLAKVPQVGEPIELHSDLVQDVAEIATPFSICTGSLDRSIVMYDLKGMEVLKRFSRKHVTGVTCLKYVQNFGGVLISVGFEAFANVWGPENLFGEAHIGKLKGHKRPIVALDVTQRKPFVYSMDKANEVIIWDVRNLSALQTIPAPGASEKLCHGLIVLFGDLFWTFGTRFITYDTQETFEEGEEPKEDVFSAQVAVGAFHNSFFSQICIQTPKDIRMYACNDGQLQVLHQNVFKGVRETIGIKQDKRHRKAYISSNQGDIRVINIQSGVTLKDIFEEEDTQERIQAEKLGAIKAFQEKIAKNKSVMAAVQGESDFVFLTQDNKEQGKDQSAGDGSKKKSSTAATAAAKAMQEEEGQNAQRREVVDKILIWEDEMQQLLYCDRQSYLIYKEEDEKSEKLRTVTGGHLTNITSIQYDYHLSLIATGTENGEVAVWDYENSQLLGICLGHSKEHEITSIQFLSPYPIMATASSDSKICLWTVRPVPQANAYINICSFLNQSYNKFDELPQAVRSLQVYSGDNLCGVSRGQSLKHSQIDAVIYREFKTSQVLAEKEQSIRVSKEGFHRGLSQIMDERIRILAEYFAEDKETGLNKIDTRFETMRKERTQNMTLLDPEYDSQVDERRQRLFLYMGDDLGYIKMFELSYYMQQKGYKPVQSYTGMKAGNFFPDRKEFVNVESYAKRLRKQAEMAAMMKPEEIDPEDSGAMIRMTRGHQGSVTKLIKHNQEGFISCSKDCQVRIWGCNLDLWGVIDQSNYHGDPLWLFPTGNKHETQVKDALMIQELADEIHREGDQVYDVVVPEKLPSQRVNEHSFSAKMIFQKMLAMQKDKKRIKKHLKEEANTKIEEERDEWQRLLNLQKGEEQVEKPKFKVIDRDQAANARIMAMLKRNDKWTNEVLNEDRLTPSKTGDVRHLNDALDKMELDSKRRAEAAKSPVKFNNNIKSPKRVSKNNSRAESDSSDVSSPSRMKKLTRLSSKLDNSLNRSLSKKQSIILSAPPNNLKKNQSMETVNSQVDLDGSMGAQSSKVKPEAIEPLQKAPSVLGMIPEREAAILDDQKGSTFDKKNNQRTLDQLNQTMSLMKKIENTKARGNKLTVKDDHQTEVEDDTKAILLSKNLPNIRGKLTSIKTRWQKAVSNPKYNTISSASHQKPAKQHSLLHSTLQPESEYGVPGANQYVQLSRKMSQNSPFLQRQLDAVDNLWQVARDLEAYNRRKHFAGNNRSNSLASKVPAFQTPAKPTIMDESHISGTMEIPNIAQLSLEKSAGIPKMHSLIKQQSDADTDSLHPHSLLLAEQRNRSLESVVSLQQLNDFRQMQSQMMMRGISPTNLRDEAAMRNQQITRTPNFFKRTLKDNQNDVEALGRKNSSLEKISFDMPSVEVPGPISAANKIKGALLEKSKKGQNAFDFLEASSASYAHGGRNKHNLVTSGSHALDQSAISASKSMLISNPSEVGAEAQLAKRLQKLKLGGKHHGSQVSETIATMSASGIDSSVILPKDPSRQYLEVTFQRDLQLSPHSSALKSIQLGHEISQLQTEQSMINEVGPGHNYSNMLEEPSLFRNVGGGDAASEFKARYESTLIRDSTETRKRTKQIVRRSSPEILERKKRDYLELKNKYIGKESKLALQVKREAENIQQQRQRIMQLKAWSAKSKKLQL